MANFWGNLVKSLRESQGISQRKLADHAAINRSTLRKLERGEEGVAIEVVEILLQKLGYELDAITVESKREVINRQNAIFAQDPEARSKLAMDRLLGVR